MLPNGKTMKKVVRCLGGDPGHASQQEEDEEGCEVF